MALEDAKKQVDTAFTHEDRRGLRYENAFGGATSFLRRNYTKDLTGVDVVRPANTETTAWGAAFLAGLGHGLFKSLEDGQAVWSADRQFSVSMPDGRRTALRQGWDAAVARVRSTG